MASAQSTENEKRYQRENFQEIMTVRLRQFDKQGLLDRW